nr:biopolymer transporter ExbD [uncultured Undibacterium sp.]
MFEKFKSLGEPICHINLAPFVAIFLILTPIFIGFIPPRYHIVSMRLDITESISPFFYTFHNFRHRKAHVINIDIDGKIYWGNTLVPSSSVLQQKMLAIVEMQKQPRIKLIPNKFVSYKYVAGVLTLAQRTGVRDICLECMTPTIPEESPEESDRLDQLENGLIL